jgi:glutamine synthetase
MASLNGLGISLDTTTIEKVSSLANSMMAEVEKLSEALTKHDFANTEAHMKYMAKTVRPIMDKVREYADALEGEVADELWPLPTYQEMLFIK